ncbi:class I SAM-dependent methyltransferase [Streptomyces sp. NBC_00893]|uniref:class I SAM-dependent methyltransferase n=1 Tax=Streptomyces sp. NBC_00893 TaxID=2975862 RepID=UPI00224FB042|nr:class I SAM-dependent methyltransferase [Streptomyces sp. NBC_00893]MCX4847279.1 methyltransferase domain-containing protein [Streptomyces sp. NBC_00893]
MTAHRVPQAIIDFYTSAINEADRLSVPADGVLEMVRTQELLRRHLPPAPASVLDVGGGPGTHARWLSEDGYQVHLVDPVPRHIAEAESAGCSVELGDARALTARDDSYDVVLLLGPLYHLVDPADRRAALAEARRAVRPGGLVAAAGINRYASLFEHTALAHLDRPSLQDGIGRILATGSHDGRKGFTEAHFHTGPELEAEMREAGLADTRVYGVEGPSWALLKATEQHTGESLVESRMFASALAAARMAEAYPDLLAAGSHLLAVGRH